MEFFDVCKVLTTHGLNGEVKVQIITDFPEDRFKVGQELQVKGTDQVLTVAQSRPFKNFYLLQFEEVADIDQAEKLRGQILVVSSDQRAELPEGVFYFNQIIGLKVVDDDSGEEIGKVSNIEQPGANDIWEVTESNGKKFWMPYVPNFVKAVDLENGEVRVTLLEGMRNED
ncbi:MAG: ribosome maturation factor RimM [Lactobacillus sp.]|nr:ribosome maturation factor RimM [Lactobacillus sp.]